MIIIMFFVGHVFKLNSANFLTHVCVDVLQSTSDLSACTHRQIYCAYTWWMNTIIISNEFCSIQRRLPTRAIKLLCNFFLSFSSFLSMKKKMCPLDAIVKLLILHPIFRQVLIARNWKRSERDSLQVFSPPFNWHLCSFHSIRMLSM